MIDIYLDGADLNAMRIGRSNPFVKGFTTNPSLARSAGVTNYETFCKQALEIADGLPISFEVLSDEWDEIERQARKIASWGSNVNVKIPITNTRGESAAPLVRTLSDDGIVCNVTAVFIMDQINDIMRTINRNDEIIISIFCGRIADTCVDPCRNYRVWKQGKERFLWASTREVLNIPQAEQSGFDIITVTPDLLKKYEELKGKDLTEFSRETVQLFFNDAKKSNYQL